MTTLRLIDGTPPRSQAGFTSLDLIALALWMQHPGRHGYRRVLIEAGTQDGGPEQAGYALFYLPENDWASWGMVRENGAVSVWNCASGLDVGRFATMDAALESLPCLARRSPQREASPPPLPRLRLVHPDVGGDFRRVR